MKYLEGELIGFLITGFMVVVMTLIVFGGV